MSKTHYKKVHKSLETHYKKVILLGVLVGVMVVLAQFTAKSFEELFQGVYHANLEDYIPKDGQFPVKGHSLNSALHAIPACQSIVKKAIVKRLMDDGKTVQEIGKQLGMKPEEVFRLSDFSKEDFLAMMAKKNTYSTAEMFTTI